MDARDYKNGHGQSDDYRNGHGQSDDEETIIIESSVAIELSISEEDSSLSSDEEGSPLPIIIEDSSLSSDKEEPSISNDDKAPSSINEQDPPSLINEQDPPLPNKKPARKRIRTKSLKCPYDMCSKAFSCQAKLNDHLNAHTNTKTNVCEVCDRKYPSIKSLNAHYKTHQEPEFECERCGREFVQKSHLKRHYLVCEVVHECPVCKKRYQKKGSLDSHLKNKHRKHASGSEH